jgi:hypothetical protein
LFSASRLLALEKQFGSTCRIVISEVTYHLIACILVIQYRDILMEHFSLHQFGVVTCGGHETLIQGVQMMLDLHPNWVVL